MKTFFLFLSTLFLFSSLTFAQQYHSRFLREDPLLPKGTISENNYIETTSPVHNGKTIYSGDPHIEIIGWSPDVPVNRIVNTIREGITDQLTILKLFSGPNIITRYPKDKETWIYHWLWSYQDEQDPNKTYLMMYKPGHRLKNNKKPVSLAITFNRKDIVESYVVKLLKVKRDDFDDK